jgi:hypothetical protein
MLHKNRLENVSGVSAAYSFLPTEDTPRVGDGNELRKFSAHVPLTSAFLP